MMNSACYHAATDPLMDALCLPTITIQEGMTILKVMAAFQKEWNEGRERNVAMTTKDFNAIASMIKEHALPRDDDTRARPAGYGGGADRQPLCRK